MNNNSAYYNARRNAPERPAAAALHYDPAGTEPPEIIATGRGFMAEEVVAEVLAFVYFVDAEAAQATRAADEAEAAKR